MEINNVSIQPEVFGGAFAGFTGKEIIRLGAVSKAWSIFVKDKYDIVLLKFVELLQVNPDDVFLDPKRVMHMIDVLRALAKHKKGSRYDKAFKDMLANSELFNLTSFLGADPKTSMEKWKRTFNVLERMYEIAVNSMASQDEHTIAILDTVVSITLTALFAHSPKHMIKRGWLNANSKYCALRKEHWEHVCKFSCCDELTPAPLKKIYNAYKRRAYENIVIGFVKLRSPHLY
jgi:hypothetical protein